MIPTGTERLILDTSAHMPSMTYRMSEEFVGLWTAWKR